jgi:hypothetical protein
MAKWKVSMFAGLAGLMMLGWGGCSVGVPSSIFALKDLWQDVLFALFFD